MIIEHRTPPSFVHMYGRKCDCRSSNISIIDYPTIMKYWLLCTWLSRGIWPPHPSHLPWPRASCRSNKRIFIQGGSRCTFNTTNEPLLPTLLIDSGDCGAWIVGYLSGWWTPTDADDADGGRILNSWRRNLGRTARRSCLNQFWTIT